MFYRATMATMFLVQRPALLGTQLQTRRVVSGSWQARQVTSFRKQSQADAAAAVRNRADRADGALHRHRKNRRGKPAGRNYGGLGVNSCQN